MVASMSRTPGDNRECDRVLSRAAHASSAGTKCTVATYSAIFRQNRD